MMGKELSHQMAVSVEDLNVENPFGVLKDGEVVFDAKAP